jgi:hypothetical protein
MKKLIILATFLILAASAQARIGETLAECTARYGPALQTDPASGMHMFAKGGFLVAAIFLDQKAAMLMVSKTARNVLNIPEPMSDHEIQLILTANGQGTPWTEGGAIVKNGKWQNLESALYAQHDRLRNTLTIFTKAWADKQAEAQKAQEASALDGF